MLSSIPAEMPIEEVVDTIISDVEAYTADEERDGYRVVRPKTVSAPVSRWGRMRSALRTSFRLLRQRDEFDVIHCNDLEPLFFAVLAKWLSRGRLKVVYDAHELETEKHAKNSVRTPPIARTEVTYRTHS